MTGGDTDHTSDVYGRKDGSLLAAIAEATSCVVVF